MGILALVVAAAVIAALFFASKKAAPPCRLLAPSALAICACALCLSATTYAWFTATSTSTVAKIESATYEVDVMINANGGWNETTGVYSVDLDVESSYPVMLTAGGTATTGYCKVDLTQSDNTTITKYTPQMPQIIDGVVNNVYTFSVSGCTRMTITPTWGEPPAGVTLIEGGEFSSGTATTDLFMMPEPTETPEPTPEEPAPEENPDDTYLVEDDTSAATPIE